MRERKPGVWRWWKDTRFPPLHPLLLVAFAACARGPEPGPITITGTGDLPATNIIRVTGLSGTELRAVARATFDDAAWQGLLRVSVSETEAIPIAGQVIVTESALDFHPAFPFDLNRRYTARFDPSRLPTPRTDAPVTTVIRFSAPTPPEPTSVTAIYPSGDVWPENMLRFYVHFSGPMSRTSGTRFVHLQDDKGQEIPDAILAAYADLWNDDGTRLTVFFDPGRVKRGVGPNVKLGRAIVRGRRYRIAIDQAWPDAQGQPLTAAFTRVFTAGPAAYAALSVKDWRITSPKAGTLTPVAIVFPAPLDHALLLRALGVRSRDGHTLPGAVATGASETAWTFTPATPWSAGTYDIAVLTLLEDPAGNKIGEPFEILPDMKQPPRPPELETLAFEVK